MDKANLFRGRGGTTLASLLRAELRKEGPMFLTSLGPQPREGRPDVCTHNYNHAQYMRPIAYILPLVGLGDQ